MPVAFRYDADDLGHALEIAVGPEDTEGISGYSLPVRPGWMVVVTAADGERPLNNVDVLVWHGGAKEPVVLRGENRVFALAEAGECKVEVVVRGSQPGGEIYAATIAPDLQERALRYPRWMRCKACKFLLQALIAALLFHIAHLGLVGQGLSAIAASLSQHAPRLWQLLQALFPNDLLKRLLDLINDYIKEPLNRLLERICQLMGMCPVAAVAIEAG